MCVCVQAPCCGKLYVCRLCHDAEEPHELDRFKVEEVQCSQCLTLQQVWQCNTAPAAALASVTTTLQSADVPGAADL